MINNLIIGIIVSISFLIGYFLRVETKKEVDNFLKEFKAFKIFKKYVIIRVIIYGILLGVLIPIIPELSLIFFVLGIIEGSVFTQKDLKVSLTFSAINFVSFIIAFLIQKPF